MPQADDSKFALDTKQRKQLFFKRDRYELRLLILELIARGYYVRRETKHHIKAERINFWPTTGTITIDGEGLNPGKGPKAFVELLEQRYPRHRRTIGGKSSSPSETSSAGHILNVDLDDLDISRDYDPLWSDRWDDAEQ